jgi:uncharacterized membrane protein YeiH
MQVWEWFSIIGTISFALQGGLIAMENKYDLFAVYLFGLITSFGGGALRHVILGEATYDLWKQERLFMVAIVCITLILLFPHFFLKSKKLWANVLDAIGIIAFAIQGSLQAVNMELPASAVVVAALLTATGGGIFRDILSQRRPILLGENIYGLWIFLVGLIIGMGWAPSNVHLLLVFVVFTGLRLLSYFYNWIIPYRQY